MIRLLVLVAVASALAAPATAADLTIGQVLDVSQGLSQLDCAKDTIRDGTSEKEVCRPYRFSGGLVLLIARDLSRARATAQNYQDAHNKLVRSMAGPDGKVPEARAADFVAEDRAILASPSEVLLDHIRWVELRVGSGAGENPIPPSVVSLLEPILDLDH